MYTFEEKSIFEFFRDDSMITKLFKTKGNDSKLNKSVFIFEGLP
jgi:hypothetical protein